MTTGLQGLGDTFLVIAIFAVVLALCCTLLCTFFIWRLVSLLRSPNITRNRRLLYLLLLVLAVLPFLYGLYWMFQLQPIVAIILALITVIGLLFFILRK